mgnify:CR=1 FL=1|jgi:ketosteroid isomerase-like protein
MNLFYAVLVSASMFATSAIATEKAGGEGAVDIAERYLAAYSTFDTEKMAPLLSDDMVFTDPTKPPEMNDGQVFTHVGKKAVLTALGGYASLYEEFSLDYKIDRRYESNGAVVFVGDVTYNILTDAGQTLTGTAPIVTVVKVNNGKIARHTDYYDYAGNVIETKN